MTDSDERIFALADMRFPSLDALHAWFTAQISGTKDEDAKADLRLADQIATQRHIERAKAAANAPIPTPPPAPAPPPEQLPADASDDEKAERMYGPTGIFGAPSSQPSSATAAPPRDNQAAEDEAVAKLYGDPVGMSFAAVHSKNPEDAHVDKPNLSQPRGQQRAKKASAPSDSTRR